MPNSSHVFIYSSARKVNMANMRLRRDVLYHFRGKRQAKNVIFYTTKVTNTLIKKSAISKEYQKQVSKIRNLWEYAGA